MEKPKDDIKQATDEKKQTEKEKGEIKTTPAQKKFLTMQIQQFNEKVAALQQIHAEATVLGNTIREFSTGIVAGEKGHSGLWFAPNPDTVIRSDTEQAKQLPALCWPQLERGGS